MNSACRNNRIRVFKSGAFSAFAHDHEIQAPIDEGKNRFVRQSKCSVARGLKLRGLNSYPDGTFTHCSWQPSLDAHSPLLIFGSLDHWITAHRSLAEVAPAVAKW